MSTTNIIVLITGANTGLGLATAQALYASPKAYSIIITSRSLDRIVAASEEVESGPKGNEGSEVTPLELQIEEDASVDSLFVEVEKRFGRLDILVNNAGVSLDTSAVEGKMTKRESWNVAYNVNVTSAHLLTERFIPLLLNSTSPRLLFISSNLSSLSISSTLPYPVDQSPPAGWPKPSQFTVPAYRTSKTAMNMMAREWVRMLKSDLVKVSIVEPGFFASGLGGISTEEARRLGKPDGRVNGEWVRTVMEGGADEHLGRLVGLDGVFEW